MTASIDLAAEPVFLENLLGGRFDGRAPDGEPLRDPVTDAVIAVAAATAIEFRAALEYARSAGGRALRALSFAERAERLRAIAELLAANKARWYEIARRNSGNTAADAAIDVDGAIGTLQYFAKLGTRLGAATVLSDGGATRLARDPAFQGIHVGVPLEGVAIHINAFNFPSWGLWEKAAVALLCGVPVLAKPATATAWLPVEMVRAVHDAGVLPPGALSVIAGRAGDLLDHVAAGDAIAFTGSAETGATIRDHPRVRAAGVRVNIEADSLNASLLGLDATPDTPVFALFVREVVREMTIKAGQKCTAIRRVLVPEAHADAVITAIAAALERVVVGDPKQDGVTMGPLVSAQQRTAAESGLQRLVESAEIVYRHAAVPDDGAFVGPTLLRARGDTTLAHDLEIFGPVATVMTYRDPSEAFALGRRGGGSLAISVFSADAVFLVEAARALASSHGRVLLVDPSIGESHTGHGIVLPTLIHGGPGRAGGGEELGGVRGLSFYHQWSAVAGSAAVLDAVAARAADVRLL